MKWGLVVSWEMLLHKLQCFLRCLMSRKVAFITCGISCEAAITFNCTLGMLFLKCLHLLFSTMDKLMNNGIYREKSQQSHWIKAWGKLSGVFCQQCICLFPIPANNLNARLLLLNQKSIHAWLLSVLYVSYSTNYCSPILVWHLMEHDL